MMSAGTSIGFLEATIASARVSSSLLLTRSPADDGLGVLTPGTGFDVSFLASFRALPFSRGAFGSTEGVSLVGFRGLVHGLVDHGVCGEGVARCAKDYHFLLCLLVSAFCPILYKPLEEYRGVCFVPLVIAVQHA